jgi:hypothetical protein
MELNGLGLLLKFIGNKKILEVGFLMMLSYLMMLTDNVSNLRGRLRAHYIAQKKEV